MSTKQPELKNRSQVNPKGTVIVMVAVVMVVLLSCVAMAVDIGHLYVVRTELQRTADAAALAGASQLPSFCNTRIEAKKYADLNSPNQGTVLVDPDILIGNWDSEARTFSPWTQPYNAVQVIVKRSQASGNPVSMFFGGILGLAQSDVSASAVAVGSAGPALPAKLRYLVDEDMFDTDAQAIQDLADDLGTDADTMLTGRGPHNWIDIPAGTVMELPTGQTGDSGIFEVQDDFPFTQSSSPSLEDFIRNNGLSDDDLDPLLSVNPISDDSMFPSLIDPNVIVVTPLFKSDLSELEEGVEAKGERRGLVAFQIIGVGDDPDGGGSRFPNLIIRFVDTSAINLDEVTMGDSDSGSESESGGNVSLELVR